MVRFVVKLLEDGSSCQKFRVETSTKALLTPFFKLVMLNFYENVVWYFKQKKIVIIYKRMSLVAIF